MLFDEVKPCVCNYVVIRAGVYQLRVILDVYIYIYSQTYVNPLSCKG